MSRRSVERVDVGRIRNDLLAEQQDLDRIVADLSAEEWAQPTPSPRWTVADQIAHLAHFDRAAATAIVDPVGFAGERDELVALMSRDAEAVDEHTLTPYRSLSPAALLATWRRHRQALAGAAATLERGTRIEWYGPPMSAASFLTARLMEAWAHGQDVVDALGARRAPSPRVRHVAQLGVITRGWSYRNRGIEPPDSPVRVALEAPSGEQWTFGTDDADDVVAGPADDFCLVVTQRRHVDDTALVTTGAAARDWMLRAQVFAGPATDGPPAFSGRGS